MPYLIEALNYTQPYTLSESEDTVYSATQMGHYIKSIHSVNQDLSNLDVILLGCGEMRGQQPHLSYDLSADRVRQELYKMHYWHPEVKIGDLGNIIQGASLADTKAALKIVLTELFELGKRVLILGGSHDLTIQQYDVFKSHETIIDFSVVDMLIDLDEQNQTPYNTYLMETLTASPNYVRQFNLIGFQSYYVNPMLIETFDKLGFDCIRLGKAREDIEQIEPMLRNTHLLSLDINAVRYSDAPCNKQGSPNGFFGDEICNLARFAGMSTHMKSFGIYGYQSDMDQEKMTAKLISQMLWYYIDGLNIQKNEASLDDREQFLEYNISFTDNNTVFLKSKKTNRWWMVLPNQQTIPCSHQDYISACNNDIPERWMREMERLV